MFKLQDAFMCWTMGSPHLVSSAPQARVAEGGRTLGPTHHARQASLFWAPLRVSGGWRAGRPSLSPSWGAQAALYEALPTPYNVPIPCSGVSFGIQSPLLQCRWEGPAQEAFAMARAAPPRRPGGSSGEGCSFITRRWMPVAAAAAWPL